nr:P-loop NTPase fold protein [Vibrio sp. SCSIO 43169]
MNREDYGKFIASVLTDDSEEKVINLNGSWGVGKTDFLRRLYVELYNSDYPVVYIDAWKSDFLRDPLALVCSEILLQLETLVFVQRQRHEVSQTNLDKLTKATFKLESYLGLVLNYTSPALNAYSLLTGEESVLSGLQEAKNILTQARTVSASHQGKHIEDINRDLIENLKSTQRQLVETMELVRYQITDIGEILKEVYGLNIPIVILIDELDRCRPTYSVKMLEVIKHFFNVKGCSFLVATDTMSLHSSIKSVYGSDFQADRYLKRFFKQQIKLARPSFQEYLSSISFSVSKYRTDEFSVFPEPLDDEKARIFLAELIEAHVHATLRDVQTVTDRIYASLNYLVKYNIKDSYYVNVAVLMIAVVEQHFGCASFEERKNNVYLASRLASHRDTTKFADIQLSCVMTTLTLRTYPNIRTNCWEDYESNIEILNIQSGIFDLPVNENVIGILSQHLLTDLQNQVYLYESCPSKFLMWDDYYTLVGLSKCISE